MRKKYVEGGIGYGDIKKELVKLVQDFVKPLREKRGELASNTKKVEEILQDGMERARNKASITMKNVREVCGIVNGHR